MPPKKQTKPRQNRKTTKTTKPAPLALRDTRVLNSVAPKGVTIRETGTYPLFEVTPDAANIQISPIGIRRDNTAQSNLTYMLQTHEQWFVHKLRFEFIPELPMTEPGSIHMSPDYDPSDSAPATVENMASNKFYTSGPVCRKINCTMVNLKAPDNSFTRPMLYTSPMTETRLTAFGSLNIQTSGVTATGVIGRIVMHYDISFHMPQVPAYTYATSMPDMNEIRWVSSNANNHYPVNPFHADTNDMIADLYSTAGAAQQMSNTGTYSGVISGFTGATLMNALGKVISIGTRLYMRPGIADLTTTGAAAGLELIDLAAASVLGKLSTSPSFLPNSEVLIKGATGAKIFLDKVVKFVL